MTSCIGNWHRGIVSAMTTAKNDHDLRAAGAAVLLELTDAAREMCRAWDGIDRSAGVDPSAVAEVMDRLDILLTELQPEPRHIWAPSTWAEVARFGAGTRVRLGGVEAVVELATATTWHVDPNSPARNPRPLETTLVKVKLMGRDQAYDFPAGNTVEVQDVNWPTVSEADWAAAAMSAQAERAVRLLAAAFGARPVS